MKNQRERRNLWTARRASGPSIALLFLLSLFAANFFVVTAKRTVEFSIPMTSIGAPHPSEPPAPYTRAFDGAPSTVGALARFAVVIDNMRDGRPPAGVNAAGLVIEAPVEAGITRWLAFFEFDTCRNVEMSKCRNVERIGPVRSLRPYFLDLATGYQTPIAHVGGSPEALARAKKSALLTLNEFGFGHSFFRDPARQDPHRIFTSQSLLQSVLERFGITASALEMSWTWERKEKTKKDDASNLLLSCVASYRFVNYPLPPEPELSWAYNVATGLFERSHGGLVQRDADGVAVSAKNVFVVETTVTVIDAIGRRRITTTGKGTAWRLTPRGKERLIWQREDGTPYRFTTADGKQLALPAGRVWITIVPAGQEVVETTCDH